MNAAIKNVWVEALHSGRYKQGRNCLRSEDDKFCCMGVLLDIGEKKRWRKSFLGNYDYMSPEGFVHNGRVAPDILEMVGLSPKDAGVLTAMNDQGESFQVIADWIDKKL